MLLSLFLSFFLAESATYDCNGITGGKCIGTGIRALRDTVMPKAWTILLISQSIMAIDNFLQSSLAIGLLFHAKVFVLYCILCT
jgi:hypothetical protein